ncbi:hypothetical protein, partial [Polaromonas sp.]|uniref:hypothetical protein n=1 Tax=Polaromonas sp. TaxID=1869339 RepID=UPI003C92ADF1
GKAGLPSHAATSPRQLAQQVMQRYGSEGQPLHDWLLQLETQRYAGTPAGGTPPRLAPLKKQYNQLSWPG